MSADVIRIPLGSRELVNIPVSIDTDDEAGVEASTVEVSFDATGDGPTDDGWVAASWALGEVTLARVLVTEPGYGSGAELPVGVYTVWVRVTLSTSRPQVHAGTAEVYDPATVAYSRWGMTTALAGTVTGAGPIGPDTLTRAETEITDWLGWEPDPADYIDHADDTPTPAAVAFGRAVAWQAVYRTTKPAAASDGAGVVKSETVDDYSVTYVGGGGLDLIAPRARRILVRWGWRMGAGATTVRPPIPSSAYFQTG